MPVDQVSSNLSEPELNSVTRRTRGLTLRIFSVVICHLRKPAARSKPQPGGGADDEQFGDDDVEVFIADEVGIHRSGDVTTGQIECGGM
jgi:hypothetical protein